MGVMSFLGSGDGNLWIGTSGGLLRVKGDELLDYSGQFAGSGLYSMIEDHTGGLVIREGWLMDSDGSNIRS
jgi:hypothetical protein